MGPPNGPVRSKRVGARTKKIKDRCFSLRMRESDFQWVEIVRDHLQRIAWDAIGLDHKITDANAVRHAIDVHSKSLIVDEKARNDCQVECGMTVPSRIWTRYFPQVYFRQMDEIIKRVGLSTRSDALRYAIIAEGRCIVKSKGKMDEHSALGE